MRYLAPSLVFGVLVGADLRLSGGPVRVHVVSVACLALAYWAPALWAGGSEDLKSRWPSCLALILAGIFAWDLTSSLVISKAEPLDIIRHQPWVYLLGVVAIGGLVAGTSIVVTALESTRSRAEPPNKPLQADRATPGR